jgi:hypothetical protein
MMNHDLPSKGIPFRFRKIEKCSSDVLGTVEECVLAALTCHFSPQQKVGYGEIGVAAAERSRNLF